MTKILKRPGRSPTRALESDSRPTQERDDASEDRRDIDSARRGDRDAFDRLVTRHQQAVINTAAYFLRDYQDALEVAQETFLKAYCALDTFRAQSSFRTWLLTIATNTSRTLQARMRTKKRSVERTVSLSGNSRHDEFTGIDLVSGDGGPASLLLRKEVKEALEDAILDLEPDFRQMIILRDLGGSSYESISEQLSLPLGTVKSKVHRARLRLRSSLERFL